MEKLVIENTKLPFYINFILFLFLGMSAGALVSALPSQDRIVFSILVTISIFALFLFIYKKSLKFIFEYFKVEFYLDKVVIKDFFGNEKIKIPISKVEAIFIAYKKIYKIYTMIIYIQTKDKKEYHIPISTLKPPSEELKVFYKRSRFNPKVEIINIDLLSKISGGKK